VNNNMLCHDVNSRQAYQKSAEFRREVDGKLMTIEESFVTVDFYVTRFPHDENIVTAATSVVFHVLKAVEQLIEFYTSNQRKSCLHLSTMIGDFPANSQSLR
jgi:hypothetical protein